MNSLHSVIFFGTLIVRKFSGLLDASFFQHYPYLEEYNKENGITLVSAGAVHYESLGLYAGKTDSIDALSAETPDSQAARTYANVIAARGSVVPLFNK